MEIIILYIILIYLVGFGTMVNEKSLKRKVDKPTWLIFSLSPVVLPIFFGMWLHESTQTTKAISANK